MSSRSRNAALIPLVMFLTCPVFAQPPAEKVLTPEAEATALLGSLKNPPLEPLLRWDWEQSAFDPLLHPIEYDFGWRLKELGRTDLPEVARARLNLELAFLNDSAARSRDASQVDYRTGMPDRPWDPMGRDPRLRLAFRGYERLLASDPLEGEFLSDIGDLHMLAGRPDSAAVYFRRAMKARRPPARVFARAASTELYSISASTDSLRTSNLKTIRSEGLTFFARPAPPDSFLAARHFVEEARFRIEMALVEFYADRMVRPDAWRYAGSDSVFTLLARVVSPPTRRLLADAADRDTSFAEAHGLLGAVVTGQILLPVAARSILYRNQEVQEDSLALAIWVLARERGEQKLPDLKYAAANLNRCETLEPGRYPVVRQDQARLSLLFGDVDGAAGLYRALLTQYPNRVSYAEELFTTLRVDAADSKSLSRSPSPEARLESALEGIASTTRSGEMRALVGWVHSARDKWPEAATDFQAAVDLDSLAWRAQLGLAVAALRDLDTQRAETHLKNVSDVFPNMDDPGKSAYCAAVGLLFLARRDIENSRKWLSESREFDPRNVTATTALKRIGFATGN